ncbi:type I toxin-antitoxin system Ibs family toxin [Shigella sonnei]|nr:type I toxin-antitoxin system Ibs family toxin [Shigella sonnei]
MMTSFIILIVLLLVSFAAY